jgi:hypothetical protein
VLNCSESETGWFAEVIQIARHCDTANRISAKPENKSMNSESIFACLNTAMVKV